MFCIRNGIKICSFYQLGGKIRKHMAAVFLNWIYIAVTAYSLGFAFSKFTEKFFHYALQGIDSVLFAGLVLATVYAQFFSLVYKVGLAANIVMAVFCAGIVFFLRREIAVQLRSAWWDSSVFSKVLLLVLIIVWGYCTSRGYMHYDSDLYHAQSIRWIEEFGVVKGLGNIHVRFAYNSSFFALSALYSFAFLLGQSLHTVNGFIALLLSVEVLKLGEIAKRKSVLLSDFARLGAFYYLTVIYRDIVAPASDYAIMCVVFFILIKWLAQLEIDRNACVPFALLCVGGTFAVSLKLTAGLLLLLTIKPVYLLIKEKKWREIAVYLVMGVIVLTPWAVRTVLISGYLLYPFPSLDLFAVDWKIGAEAAALDAAEIKTWGRGLNNAALVDLPITQWFPNWFHTALPVVGRLLVLADIVCVGVFAGLAVYLFLSRTKYQKNMIMKRNKIESGLDELLVLGTVGASYLFWQCSAPLLRYGYAYVLLMAVLTFGIVWILILQNIEEKNANFQRIASTEKKNSNISIITSRIGMFLIVIFTLTKSVSLAGYIISTADKPYYLQQSDYGTYVLHSYAVNGVTFYYPETGDRVGYQQFPAIPRKVDVAFRGNKIKEGFYGK